MDKRIREKLREKLLGFEYRQEARGQRRTARQRAYHVTLMMRENGTLRGARKYLELKSVKYVESRDPSTGRVTLTVPGQATFVYDAAGNYVTSGPPMRQFSAG